MNPIKITLLTLGIWIILTLLYILNFVVDVSEKPFEVAIYSFYLIPFICILAFVSSLFFYRLWISKNKIIVILFLLILVAWSFSVIVYIKSLLL